jgi:hypothetical protein
VPKGLGHNSLACSNLLIHPSGDLKFDFIADIRTETVNQDHSELSQNHSTESQFIQALSKVVEELMNGYPKEDEVIGVDDLYRWHPNSYAVNFLSATVTATSLNDLRRVCIRGYSA